MKFSAQQIIYFITITIIGPNIAVGALLRHMKGITASNIGLESGHPD
jgi:hypothetical protein